MKKIKWFTFWIGLLSAGLILGFILPGLITAGEAGKPASDAKHGEVEDRWGIKPLSIRLTGANHFLDFRYLVLDVEKAMPVMRRNTKAILEDQETGETFHVAMTKITGMRRAAANPKPGIQYYILFANSDKIIKRGQRMTVIMDECRIEDLVVE
jgi:hypothetical protein